MSFRVQGLMLSLTEGKTIEEIYQNLAKIVLL
jgi:hypothetical protein